MVEVFSILIFSDLWACWMRAIDLFRKNLKYFERLGHCPVYFYIIFVRFFISLLFVKGVVSKEAALFLCWERQSPYWLFACAQNSAMSRAVPDRSLGVRAIYS